MTDVSFHQKFMSIHPDSPYQPNFTRERGATSIRLTNPAVDLHNLPRIDLVLLSYAPRQGLNAIGIGHLTSSGTALIQSSRTHSGATFPLLLPHKPKHI
jgi:hypothetical protein